MVDRKIPPRGEQPRLRPAGRAKACVSNAFKTSQRFDGTVENPHWLEEARL